MSHYSLVLELAKSENLSSFQNDREIYSTIKTLRSNGFDHFVKWFIKKGHQDLASILKLRIAMMNQTEESLVNADENGSNRNQIPNEEERFRVRVKTSAKFMDKPNSELYYAMRSKPRGLVLIISNIDFCDEENYRLMGERDEENLKTLFEQMGFKPEVCRNLTSAEMIDKFESFSNHEKLYHVDSIFVVTMTHGGECKDNGCTAQFVTGSDKQCIKESDILKFFTASACEAMRYKPKIFIFQTCRGENSQKLIPGSTIGMSQSEKDINMTNVPEWVTPPTDSPDYSNLLLAHSTLPGYKSYRCTKNGSWYIQILCEVFMNHACDTELYGLFQMIDRKLSVKQTEDGNCQTSAIHNYGFNKKCYLNPGFFDNQTV